MVEIEGETVLDQATQQQPNEDSGVSQCQTEYGKYFFSERRYGIKTLNSNIYTWQKQIKNTSLTIKRIWVKWNMSEKQGVKIAKMFTNIHLS